MQDYLTVKEVAHRLDKHETTILRAIKNGHLKAEMFGAQWIIKLSDFEKYQANQPKVGRPPKSNQHH